MFHKYTSLLKTFLGSKISTITLFITNHCNANCKMCFNWKNLNCEKDRRELTLEEIEKVAKGFRKIKLHSLIISGGEPFLRDDLAEIIGLFHSLCGTAHVSIPTNLFLENVPERIKNLVERFPRVFFRILMGIDGVGTDHDLIRGVSGGFQKLEENYKKIVIFKRKFRNLSLNVTTVLSFYNMEKIMEVLDFSNTLDVDDIKLIYVRGDTRQKKAKDVSPDIYNNAIKYGEQLTVEKNRTKSFYNNVLSSVSLVAKEIIAQSLIEKKQLFSCTAGKKMIVVSDVGEVFPCELLNQKLGDLRESDYNILKVMKSQKAKEILSFIEEKKCFCTMDCNIISTVVYNPYLYWRVFKKLLAFYKFYL